MKIEIKPSPPQTKALASQADILIYGGSAGGGKSFELLMEPVRYLGNSGFKSLIFRRTYAMITEQGGLWDEASEMYPYFGGSPNQSNMVFKFPSGATVAFSHMQHEKDKLVYQGAQLAMIGFDELMHFSESQFFYMLSRARSKCGVRPFIRATCNPEPGWVYNFIQWWINPVTGLPIPERDGVLRWFYRKGDEIDWFDTCEEAREAHPELAERADPKSVTFVAAKLEDNKVLMESNPEYLGNLMALPRIERERLLAGNWKISEGTQIPLEWFRRYRTTHDDQIEFKVGAKTCRGSKFDRYAVIDTAGTSEQKAQEKKGKPPSYTCMGMFDHDPKTNAVMLRDVWRKRVSWSGLLEGVPEVMEKWDCNVLDIENAHFGPALYEEMRGAYRCRLVGPSIAGMGTKRGAKLERAVASGMLAHVEHGKFFVPLTEDRAYGQWTKEYLDGVTAWTGLDDEIADWVDVMSYAIHRVKKSRQRVLVV